MNRLLPRPPGRPVSRTVMLSFVGIAVTLFLGCTDGPSPFLTRLMEARRLSSELLIDFTKAADASNLTVMADTDVASTQYSREATQAIQAVQRDLAALSPLLRSLDYAEEEAMLKEFAARFAKYRALDSNVLDLAVESTNLKAERLAFGPAMEQARVFEAALTSIGSASTSDTWQVKALASAAISGLRGVQVLVAPHIASADDAVMTALEAEIATEEGEARQALAALTGLELPDAQSPLQTASAALERFNSITKEIIALSRRNTNVRSLALSLGQKRMLAGACEESLQALQKALHARRDSPATR